MEEFKPVNHKYSIIIVIFLSTFSILTLGLMMDLNNKIPDVLDQKRNVEIISLRNDSSAIKNQFSSKASCLEQFFDQVKSIIPDMMECIKFCVNGRCIYENNSFLCMCNSGYNGTNCSEKIFSSCNNVPRAGNTSNGVYYITVPGRTNPVQVYCDLNTDGGGWLVFQRRMNGRVDFYRNWSEYQQGFGDLNGEFWLGLDLLHAITYSRSYQLRVDLEDWDGNTSYAVYRNFSVGSLQSNYSLSVNGYNGTAGDALSYHNNQQFSTKDRDNDEWSDGHCAQFYHGVWWYNQCYYSNLNGKYLRNEQNNGRGVYWYYWKNSWYSMKRAEMKIKPN